MPNHLVGVKDHLSAKWSDISLKWTGITQDRTAMTVAGRNFSIRPPDEKRGKRSFGALFFSPFQIRSVKMFCLFESMVVSKKEKCYWDRLRFPAVRMYSRRMPGKQGDLRRLLQIGNENGSCNTTWVGKKRNRWWKTPANTGNGWNGKKLKCAVESGWKLFWVDTLLSVIAPAEASA